MATGSVKILFDENFSQNHVIFIRDESNLAEIHHMRTIGWGGMPDPYWIPLAAGNGFVVVTWDRNARTRGYTVADLKTLQARFILLGSFFDHMKCWAKAQWLVRYADKIVALAAGMDAGSVVIIDRNCRSKQL